METWKAWMMSAFALAVVLAIMALADTDFALRMTMKVTDPGLVAVCSRI